MPPPTFDGARRTGLGRLPDRTCAASDGLPEVRSLLVACETLPAAEKALDRVLEETPDSAFEAALKATLRKMMKG